MHRQPYHYNPKTCNYEPIRKSTWEYTLSSLRFISCALVFSICILLVYITNFNSPKESQLLKDNSELKHYYTELVAKLRENQQELKELQDRDDNLYRVLLDQDPFPAAVRKAGTGGVDRYANLKNTQPLISDTLRRADELTRQIYVQSKSYGKLELLAKEYQNRCSSIPAINPISKHVQPRISRHFGIGLHPIYKIMKMHEAIDLAAPRGTPVQSSGGGIVKFAGIACGYGNMVEINHGFGFNTIYGHLNKITVRNGQRVRRGQLIGLVGMTGAATAPHLHYEVIRNQKKVNPIHYLFNDLSAEEYDAVLEQVQ